jgi:hypothetical protein
MASTYLTKTSTTVTNDKKFTVSAWVKGSDLGGSVQAGVCGHRSTTNAGNSSFQFGLFNGGYYAAFVSNSGNDVHINKVTNRLLRDVHAWYHLVIAVDSTLGTASDRVKMYINGELQTSFSTDVNPPQDRTFLNNSCNIDVGRLTYTDGSFKYWDGAIAHFHFVDGTAYPASTFAETDTTTGIWKPKTAPSVTYGNNGFFLKFENSGAMGTDSSGNSNTFTVNGSMTQLLDTPSNVYVNLNSLGFQDAANSQLSNTNTTFTGATSGDHNLTIGNLAVDTGKWYWELKLGGTINDYSYIGIRDIESNPTKQQYVGTVTGGVALRSDGYLNIDGSFPSQFSGISYTTGDIISVGLDLDNNKIYWYENGTLINSGGTTITNRLYAPSASMVGNNGIFNFNFGNGFFGTTAIASAGSNGNGSLFEYDVPSGYYALNTKNINSHG